MFCLKFKRECLRKFFGLIALTVLTWLVAYELAILRHHTAQGWLPFPVNAVNMSNNNAEQNWPIHIGNFSGPTTIFDNSLEREKQMENLQALISDIRRYIPPSEKFLPEFKNPCWYADGNNIPTASALNNTHLQCLPYAFLLGFPKSGSSKLYSLIEAHHEYAQPLGKEVSIAQFLRIKPPIQNTLSYLKHFEVATKQIAGNPRKAITCDGTPTTALVQPNGYWSDEAPIDGMPMLLQELLPNAKYIVIMRNPLYATRSEFYYTLGSFAKHKSCAHITEQPATVLHELVCAHIQAHQQCVSHFEDEIKCLFHRYYTLWLKPGLCGHFLMEYSVYYFTLLLWLKHIPRERFHFVYNDEMERDPLRVAKQVYEFLGMSPMNTRQWETLKSTANTKVNTASFLDKNETTNSSIPFMKQETVDLLRAFYQPFNAKLAALIGDNSVIREWDFKLMSHS